MKFKIYHFDVIDSTSAALKKEADRLPLYTVYTANQQARGYGRNGRNFHSKNGMYFSILLEDTACLPLTAAACVCLAKAVEKVSGLPTDIKWLNDLYSNNKKIAGILCERITLPNRKKYQILGIGLNIENPDFDTELAKKAGYLKQFVKKEISKEDLLKAFLEEFEKFLDNPKYDWYSYYCPRLLWKEENILVMQGHKAFEARLIGINKKGELLVNKEDSIYILNSGEIHLFKT